MEEHDFGPIPEYIYKTDGELIRCFVHYNWGTGDACGVIKAISVDAARKLFRDRLTEHKEELRMPDTFPLDSCCGASLAEKIEECDPCDHYEINVVNPETGKVEPVLTVSLGF